MTPASHKRHFVAPFLYDYRLAILRGSTVPVYHM
jgi:hypothetical protein